MARPKDLRTKIFLDSASPEDTRELLELLGFLDGQTTNPTLLAKNPAVAELAKKGRKLTESELLKIYKKTAQDISDQIPDGSVSIEVYSDINTGSEAMLEQGKEFFSWIPNAHIKFPSTYEGFKAARKATTDDIRVNMTLCFSQQQAAATHAATKGAAIGDVFVSPFIGRLDDKGENGLDLVQNIIRMYQECGSHVQVLAASVRTMNHFIAALELGADIITAPPAILRDWARDGMPLANGEIHFQPVGLAGIPYEDLDLDLPVPSYSVTEVNPLTLAGLQKFSTDWNSLISK